VSRRLPAISVLASIAVFVLCACDPSTGTTSNPTTSATAAATTVATAKPAKPAQSVGWVLSMPDEINGEQRLTNPTSTTQAKLQQGIQEAEQNAGLTGRPALSGIYDDAAADAWLVVIGVNGSGFSSSHLVASVDAEQPGFSKDGNDVTATVQPATVGPHGGTAICQQTSESIDTVDGTVSAATGTCYWMTSTTFGVVTLITKEDAPTSDFFISASTVNSAMQYVRAAVETRAA
jgi:hypothetical protein